jgi:hypothetical protein
MDLSRLSPLFDLINAELAEGILKDDDTHPIRSGTTIIWYQEPPSRHSSCTPILGLSPIISRTR